jgi:hypothetical protein
MASSPQPTRLVTRASPILRLYGGWAVLVGLGWIAIGFFASGAEGGGLSTVPGGALLTAYGVRVIRARVVALPDEVRVYNRFRNYRFDRTDVHAVELRRNSRTLWQTLRLPRPQRTAGVLVLRSRKPIRMFATERSDYGAPQGYFGPPKNAQQVEALRDYLGLSSPDAGGSASTTT